MEPASPQANVDEDDENEAKATSLCAIEMIPVADQQMSSPGSEGDEEEVGEKHFKSDGPGLSLGVSSAGKFEIQSSRPPQHAPPSRQPSFDDLFFDLLFAAALSVYSNNAELSSAKKIAIFIGSFALLWWSWWTQTRFDVRFRGRDPLSFAAQCAQRIVRCALLGVWVALATVTSEFARDSHANFIAIYVGSRAALILDYGIIIAESLFNKQIEPRDDHIPGAVERRQRGKALSPIASHVLMATGTLVSAMMWLGSRFIRSDSATLPSSVVGIWIAGISLEMLTEVFIELRGTLRSLSATPIVERLALFTLIVFGNGFEKIGEILNTISPGSHETENRRGQPIGGWSSVTMVNAGASVLIVLLLFYGYFSRAIKNFTGHPARMMVWAYVHLALHASTAVLMIGLGKAIGFVNTLVAFHRFFENPQDYLPNTPDWKEYLTNGSFVALLESDVPVQAIEHIENYYDRTIMSTLTNTAVLQGAVIPGLQLNAALINATVPFDNLTLPAVVTQALHQFASLVHNVHNPDGISTYVDKNLYTYYFAYLCPAIFMFADTVLKLLQHSSREGGIRSIERSLVASLFIRVAFGVVLVIVQVTYLTQLDKFADDNAILYCLVILACIMLAESLLQFGVTVFTQLRAAHHMLNNKRKQWAQRRKRGKSAR